MSIANVDRALTLIETLAAAPGGLSLRSLAEQLEMPKSAMHRLLQTLAERGYVHQEPASQDYFLSLRVALLRLPLPRRTAVARRHAAGTRPAGARVR
jgi:DNA-binding IclR family transcriptional regulator